MIFILNIIKGILKSKMAYLRKLRQIRNLNRQENLVKNQYFNVVNPVERFLELTAE